TTEQLSLRLDSAGHLIVSRQGTTLATSTNTLTIATWYWIEFKATINNATGSFEVRVNGSATGWIPQQTNQNTRATGNNSANGFALGNAGNTPGFFFDDVVVADDFVGQGQIVTLRPQAAGNYQQWTPNYGTNFGSVEDWVFDGDNSFVQSSTSG